MSKQINELSSVQQLNDTDQFVVEQLSNDIYITRKTTLSVESWNVQCKTVNDNSSNWNTAFTRSEILSNLTAAIPADAKFTASEISTAIHLNEYAKGTIPTAQTLSGDMSQALANTFQPKGNYLTSVTSADLHLCDLAIRNLATLSVSELQQDVQLGGKYTLKTPAMSIASHSGKSGLFIELENQTINNVIIDSQYKLTSIIFQINDDETTKSFDAVVYLSTLANTDSISFIRKYGSQYVNVGIYSNDDINILTSPFLSAYPNSVINITKVNNSIPAYQIGRQLINYHQN